MNNENKIPKGYKFWATKSGIKTDSLDLGVIYSEKPANIAAAFTGNIVKGAPVIIGKEIAARGKAQAVVVNSGNSNVANGKQGLEWANEVCSKLACELQVNPELVFPSSTGVIGRPLPVKKMTTALAGVKNKLSADASQDFATAILTTDTHTKIYSTEILGGHLWACAKGAGMIEPNLLTATMLAYFITDLDIEQADLRLYLTRAIHNSFNAISIDTDTSTSDTVLLMANATSAKKIKTFNDGVLFQEALTEASVHLAKELVIDGEGVNKLITVDCSGAIDEKQARKIAKLVVNSPLVKTAVHGADPNWGRLLMAVGKSFDTRIDPDKIELFLIDSEDKQIDIRSSEEGSLSLLQNLMKKESVHFGINLNLGKSFARVWGCDLSREYIHINADYTT